MPKPKMTIWWKNGDHPAVRPYPVNDDSEALTLCPECGQEMQAHGYTNNEVIHPGDAISINELADGYKVERPDNPATAAYEAIQNARKALDEHTAREIKRLEDQAANAEPTKKPTKKATAKKPAKKATKKAAKKK